MPLLTSLLPSFVRQNASCETTEQAATLRPAYTVAQKDDTYTLTVQLPGVSKNGLTITDENGTLTVRGDRAWKQPNEWTALYRESNSLPFSLSLSHDNIVDVEKAVAELKDGVLTLALPKSEARKPRKIAVS